MAMLLKNCRLVPELTEGYEGTSADVRTEGGKIEKIVPCGTMEYEGEVLDVQGKTLLP